MPRPQSPRDKDSCRGDPPASWRISKGEFSKGDSWSLRCLPVRRRCRRALATEDPLQAPQDAGSHIQDRDGKKRGARKEPNRRADHAQQHNQAKGMPRTKIDILEAIETPRA